MPRLNGLSPIAAKVVADLDLRYAVHLLRHQPAVADAFARGTQDHRSEPMTMLGIMLLIPRHPVLHPRLIKRRRIKPHDLRIAENAQQCRNVVRGHPTQVEAWGFEGNSYAVTMGHALGLSLLCMLSALLVGCGRTCDNLLRNFASDQNLGAQLF